MAFGRKGLKTMDKFFICCFCLRFLLTVFLKTIETIETIVYMTELLHL